LVWFNRRIARGRHGPKAGHGAARVLLRYILPGWQIGGAADESRPCSSTGGRIARGRHEP